MSIMNSGGKKLERESSDDKLNEKAGDEQDNQEGQQGNQENQQNMVNVENLAEVKDD